MLYASNIDEARTRLGDFIAERKRFKGTARVDSLPALEGNFDLYTAHHVTPGLPADNNVTENVIKQLNKKVRLMEGFKSVESAELYVRLLVGCYRFKRFTDSCRKISNGKAPLELAGGRVRTTSVPGFTCGFTSRTGHRRGICRTEIPLGQEVAVFASGYRGHLCSRETIAMAREDPVDDALTASIASADAALKAGDWLAARDAFGKALALGETPEALNGLGEALWWLGETSASIDHRERAYSGFRARPDPDRAVDIALGLSVHYQANVGNAPASSGWLARARRLVDEFSLDSYRGWIALFDAGEAGDPVAVERLSRDALETARGVGDADLELCALAQIGSALVSQGRVAEGVALLDEAMAGSLGGEGGDFETIVFTSCNMIGSCTRCAEFERAVQWIRAADRFTRRYGCPFMYLFCRVHYGQILTATGDWTEAEAQLTSALKESQGSQAPLHAFASAALAELRFAQGRVEEAEELIEAFGGQGPAAAMAASLHLARGKPSLAASTARRALGEADPLGRAMLAELLGNAEIALGENASADARGRELSEHGAAVDCELIRARGERLRGRASGAREHLDKALSIFARIAMPHEVARTQLMLAEMTRHTEPEVAEAEARSALATFEGLGAGRDADAAAALLRELGVKAARSGPKGRGTLTKRETEVLALVAEGLSNPEIAERLYLSRKTVEHHVASILPKLGARNRAEAVRIAATGSLAK